MSLRNLDFSKPLPPTGCRWIHGDAAGFDSKWCDAPVSEPGGSWCAGHRAKIFRPRESEQGNVTTPKPQRPGTMALAPTVAPMRGAA